MGRDGNTMQRDDLMRVDGSIQVRSRFSSPYDYSIRTGETVIIRPDDGQVGSVLALVESVASAADAQGRRLVGSIQILGIVDDNGTIKPIAAVPPFFGQLDVFNEVVGAAYYGRVELQVDPATRLMVLPAKLCVGSLLTHPNVPVVLNACGFNRHTVVLAQSGAGKSYALGVLIEELLTRTSLRIVILDPNGDFTTLDEIPGASSVHVASSRDPSVYRRSTRALFGAKTRAVAFDLNMLDPVMWDAVIADVLSQLWDKRDSRRPTVILIDEAHNFVPAAGDAGVRVATMVTKIAAEGRKYGLWLILASQRPQKLNANVISQCDNMIVMKLSSQFDMDYVSGSYGGVSSDLIQLAAGFKPGAALIVGKIVRSPTLVRFRTRTMPEAGGDIPLNWGSSPAGEVG